MKQYTNYSARYTFIRSFVVIFCIIYCSLALASRSQGRSKMQQERALLQQREKDMAREQALRQKQQKQKATPFSQSTVQPASTPQRTVTTGDRSISSLVASDQEKKTDKDAESQVISTTPSTMPPSSSTSSISGTDTGDIFGSAATPVSPSSSVQSPLSSAAPASVGSDNDDIFGDLDTTPVTPAPSAPSSAAAGEISIPISLPIIGNVYLNPFTEGSVSGLKVYIPSKDAKLDWGPLVIDKGELRLINNVPSFAARATFFGSAATLTLKSAAKDEQATQELESASPAGFKAPSFSKMIFNINFAKKPTLELIPGKQAILDTVDLVLEKGKSKQLVANAVILSQPIPISFSIEKDSTDASMQMNNVAFGSIIPELNGTPAGNIMLKSFTLKAQGVTGPKNKIVYSIDGKADVSGVAQVDATQDAQNVTINGSYSVDKGGTFTLSSKSVRIPSIGTVNDAQFIVSTGKGKTKISLLGGIQVTFAGVGDFDAKINATVSDKGMDFSSTVQQTAHFAGLDIKNITLNFSSAKKEISLSGDTQIQGYQTKITLDRDEKKGISAQASITEKELAIPGLPTIAGEKLSFKNPVFKFASKAGGYEMYMTGVIDIYGLPLQGTMNLEKTSSGMVTLIKAAAPPHFKLSQAKGLSSLKGTLLDNIELEELTFVVSSGDYNDTEQNVKYRKGINFVSKTKLSGDLVPVSKFTSIPQTSLLTIVGYLAPNPLQSTFTVDIPTGVVIKKSSGEPRNDVTLGKLELEISAITFALLTQLMVKPSAKDDLLTFTARIQFKGAPPTAFLAGTMEGFWDNPFGIHGLEIGNVAAQIGFGPAFPPFPASIGVAGQMALGSRHVVMALKVPIAGDTDMVLCGALDKLTLGDMIDTAIKLAGTVSGKKISSVQIPDIGIEDMKVYVAPKDTSIGELHFDKGVTIRGIMFIPGFKAFGNLTVSDSGLIAQASCTEIRYGGTHDNPFLLISRAKEDTFKADQANKKALAQHVDAAASKTTSSDDDIFGDLDTTPTTPGTQSSGTPAPSIPPATVDSYKKARSADVACAPDNKLLDEYNGPTMHIILNMTAPFDKQGILVSGLFKVADIFEEDSYFRMDQNGIEFNFETNLGKTLYVDTTGKPHPLLKTLINGKSSGGLSNPDFKIALEFQQYLLTYVREQTAFAITQAKADVVLGAAGASQSAVKGIDQAKADVQKAKDNLAAIQKQIDQVNKTMRDAINNAGKDRATLDADIEKLKQQISDKQRLCS